MIESFDAELPHGITLACRASGPRGAPVIVFLHGFPEGAFVWDGLLERFSDRFRCIAPNLRGYGRSSSPTEVEAYRVKHLMADVAALLRQQSSAAPVEALVAHDWGGAVAWSLAALQPGLMKRLAIVNAPHPAAFLRELQGNPRQRAASAYMNEICEPGAEQRLCADDFAAMWPFFERIGATDAGREGSGWLTPDVRDRYREIWRTGLTGGLNYYRASPLKPPTGPDSPVLAISFAPEFVTVRVPVLVIWGEDDRALPPALVDGLETWVPDLRLVRVPGATHWIVHERPTLIADELKRFLV